jgi:hypothetical protein
MITMAASQEGALIFLKITGDAVIPQFRLSGSKRLTTEDQS